MWAEPQIIVWAFRALSEERSRKTHTITAAAMSAVCPPRRTSDHGAKDLEAMPTAV